MDHHRHTALAKWHIGSPRVKVTGYVTLVTCASRADTRDFQHLTDARGRRYKHTHASRMILVLNTERCTVVSMHCCLTCDHRISRLVRLGILHAAVNRAVSRVQLLVSGSQPVPEQRSAQDHLAGIGGCWKQPAVEGCCILAYVPAGLGPL